MRRFEYSLYSYNPLEKLEKVWYTKNGRSYDRCLFGYVRRQRFSIKARLKSLLAYVRIRCWWFDVLFLADRASSCKRWIKSNTWYYKIHHTFYNKILFQNFLSVRHVVNEYSIYSINDNGNNSYFCSFWLACQICFRSWCISPKIWTRQKRRKSL